MFTIKDTINKESKYLSIKEINEIMLYNVRNPHRNIKANSKREVSVKDLEELQLTSVYIKKLLESKTREFYGSLI